MSFRENQATVVHIDTDLIRAAAGLQDLFARPSITLQARYAIPRASTSKLPESSRQPTIAPEGDDSMNIDGEVGGESSKPNGTSLNTNDKGWIAGDELDKVVSEDGWEEKYDLKWPFRYTKGEDDWEGREFLLTKLYTLLEVKISSNTSPLLLLPPPSPPALSLPSQEQYTQIAFETLNVPGFSILPTPLAALFALGATTGIILNIGYDRSEITIITESIVRYECSTTVDVGQIHCEDSFQKLLLADDALDRELRVESGLESNAIWESGQKEKLVKEICEVIWRECTGDDIEIPAATVSSKAFIAAATHADQEVEGFDVAKKLVGDPTAPGPTSHKSKKAQAASAAAASKAAAQAAAQAAEADVININIPSLPGKEITIGAVRHRICEPLLRGRYPGGETVWEGMGRALESATISVAERMMVWEGVGVIGEVSRIRSFAPALMTYLAPFLLSSADLPSDTQPSKVRLLHIPDYFANFKGSTSELAPFLGGSMAAKTVFSEAAGKHCITKVDYNAKGPVAIYAIAPVDDR